MKTSCCWHWHCIDETIERGRTRCRASPQTINIRPEPRGKSGTSRMIEVKRDRFKTDQDKHMMMTLPVRQGMKLGRQPPAPCSRAPLSSDQSRPAFAGARRSLSGTLGGEKDAQYSP